MRPRRFVQGRFWGTISLVSCRSPLGKGFGSLLDVFEVLPRLARVLCILGVDQDLEGRSFALSGVDCVGSKLFLFKDSS